MAGRAARAIIDEGIRTSYEGRPTVELEMVDIVVESPGDDDRIIERFGDSERLGWMHANFTLEGPVQELGGAASYATRLYDYEQSGRDQINWVIERLRTDPRSRSAVITTLQPLSDTSYIPCVSLLQFWLPAGGVEMIVTAHSIDFGTKGYANLVELAALQHKVASKLGTGLGRLVLRITSAHLYESDLQAMGAILAAAQGS